MPVVGKGSEIDKSALIIVNMQNDFLHRDGSFRHIAHPYCVTDDRSRLLRALASAPRVVSLPYTQLQDWSRIADVADIQLGIADEMRTEQRDRFEAGGCLGQPRNAPLRAYNVFHPLRLRPGHLLDAKNR